MTPLKTTKNGESYLDKIKRLGLRMKSLSDSMKKRLQTPQRTEHHEDGTLEMVTSTTNKKT